MSSDTEDKKCFTNKIHIVTENIASISSRQNENNRSNEANELNENTLNENVVEKYLQSVFRPMNIMEAMFISAKYRIRDNIISPNSHLYCVMSICAVIILMAFIYVMFFMSSNRTGLDVYEYFFLNIYDFILYFIGGFVDAMTKIRHRFNNVYLVLKIQNVHRILNLSGNSFNYFIMFNWACVIAINCFHIFWTCMYFYFFYEIGLANIISSYTCIRFDMHMICASRTLKLINKTLQSWKTELRITGFVNGVSDDRYWESMFESYVDILQTFKIFEKSFHQEILFYIVHTSSNALLDIWIRIKMKSPDYNDIQYAGLALMALTWVFKNLSILASLSVECERFYSTVTEVQCVCIEIVTSGRCSETQKRFCKNIQREKNATFRKMGVCDLFSVDAEMMVQVVDFITTYTIVLLQFEFL